MIWCFIFLMLKKSLKILKTSCVFVSPKIRKQKLHKKCNRGKSCFGQWYVSCGIKDGIYSEIIR